MKKNVNDFFSQINSSLSFHLRVSQSVIMTLQSTHWVKLISYLSTHIFSDYRTEMYNNRRQFYILIFISFPVGGFSICARHKTSFRRLLGQRIRRGVATVI
jgi:hypothetical protein